jgi:formiminotetrahydrofolate cyclodeaminase
MAAFKLPKDTPEQEVARLGTIEAATLEAARVPLANAQRAVTVMALAERVVALGNLNAISDGASAVAMGRAALTSAAYNVRINVSSLQDKAAGEDLLAQVAALEERAARLEAEMRKSMQERAGLGQA